MKSPQKKGKDFEREIAKYLSNKFNTEVRRTPCSGAIHPFMPQDIICIDIENILNRLHIECKKSEKLNIWEVFEKTRKIAKVGKIPIVVWGKNFCNQALVVIGQYDFFDLIKEIEDIQG